MLSFGIEPSVLHPQLIDSGGQFVDPLQPLAQQHFQRADVALLVGEFAAQANNDGLQSIVLALQLRYVDGRLPCLGQGLCSFRATKPENYPSDQKQWNANTDWWTEKNYPETWIEQLASSLYFDGRL